MQDPTIQERFEALRQAYIAQNPVDLRDDEQVKEAVEAFRALAAKNPYDSRACVACDAPGGGGNLE